MTSMKPLELRFSIDTEQLDTMALAWLQKHRRREYHFRTRLSRRFIRAQLLLLLVIPLLVTAWVLYLPIRHWSLSDGIGLILTSGIYIGLWLRFGPAGTRYLSFCQRRLRRTVRRVISSAGRSTSLQLFRRSLNPLQGTHCVRLETDRLVFTYPQGKTIILPITSIHHVRHTDNYLLLSTWLLSLLGRGHLIAKQTTLMDNAEYSEMFNLLIQRLQQARIRSSSSS